MIRVVLVGHPGGHWKLYRQPQWMAEVRRNPAASSYPRRHFDLDEAGFRVCLDHWTTEGADSDREAALALLARSGGSEVEGPGSVGAVGP